MCGILGQASFDKAGIWDRQVFERALDLQTHRGPDDRGVKMLDYGILGHRRLSILDLDPRAKQPMTSDDGGMTIVYNGEIYNFQELRTALEKEGCRFRTTGDTEVLLKGFLVHGIEFLQRCIGMFAFCAFDSRKNIFYLVRDRLGIKPLYYCYVGEVLTFSSSLESLLLVSGISRELNQQAISSYLSYRYPIGNQTFFKNVNELAPGHILRFSSRGVQIKKYWDLPIGTRKHSNGDLPEEEYTTRLRELINNSVKYRMISDVPVGAYLSGGVDSAALVSVMSQYSDSPVRTFTIGYEAEGYSEFAQAREVAKRCNTVHTEILQQAEDYLELMEKLIRYKGAPLAVPNEVPLWSLSKELKQHVTVVLSGEGADESFFGYGRIFRLPIDYLRMNSNYRWSSTESMEAFKRKIYNKHNGRTFGSWCEHFISAYSYTSMEDKKQLLSKDIPLDGIEQRMSGEFEELFRKSASEAYEDQISHVFLKIHLPGLLQRLDNATMAASVEGRVPFVDHRVVEYAMTIPVQQKLRWKSDGGLREVESLLSDEISEDYDVPKYVLRKAFESDLGHEFVNQRKIGFPVPLHRWFNGTFRDMAKSYLVGDTARSRGIYNTACVEQWINSTEIQTEHAKAMKIWMLLNLEIFLRNFFDDAHNI